ncbi:MAG TPA: 6-bladed beta-propeller, partial [Longimicrobiaceae bacterium]|nr:6-bladed beta-propeller [Longimicrobiaceae bacterium]
MQGILVRVIPLAALAAGLLAAPAARAQQTVRLPEKDRALALRAAPVYAVGRAEGNDWEMFTRVDRVAFDRADNLYVLDGGAQRVLVFDRAGRFVRQVGKKGGGPGEFLAPMGMAVLADGTLAVSDLGHRSYSLFAADGRYLRSVPFADEWMPMTTALAAHPRGGVVGPVRPAPAMRITGGASRSETLQSTPILWHRLDEGAQPVRLFDAPQEWTMRQSGSGSSGGQQTVTMRMTGPPTFSPPLSWGVLGDGGMVVSHTPGYTLKVLDAGGRPVRYVQKPMRVRKVTAEDRERERERRRQMFLTGEGMQVITVGGPGRRGAGLSREMVEEQVRGMEFADVIPAIQGLRVDGAGRIWVERTGESWGEPGPIDVVTAEGRYLGTVTGQALPDAFSASGRAAY